MQYRALQVAGDDAAKALVGLATNLGAGVHRTPEAVAEVVRAAATKLTQLLTLQQARPNGERWAEDPLFCIHDVEAARDAVVVTRLQADSAPMIQVNSSTSEGRTAEQVRDGLDEAYSPPQFKLADKYAYIIKHVAICLTFGSACPLLYCICFVALAMMYVCQKAALGQDALLICAPAERARARRAAFAFAELVNAEAYYVGVSPDTAEADLRQRRELTGAGSAAWSDAAPVRAALAGGVLILDGLERAERNVLPTLNNLLENRELALDDGRRLVPEWRLAQLREEVDVPLLPVPQTFRVIAPAFRVRLFYRDRPP